MTEPYDNANTYQTGPLGSTPGTAQDQVKLPLSVAFRISVQGIRKRLGRSVVTVLGVALGTAFLMSVLAGVIIKDAVADEAEARQEVSRRVTLIRSQIGRLDDKSLIVVGRGLDPINRRVLEKMINEEGATIATVGVDEAVAGTVDRDTLEQVSAMIGLNEFEAVAEANTGTIPPDTPVFALGSGEIETTDARGRAVVTAAGLDWQWISTDRRAEQIERERQREQEQMFRVYWIVGASLLITAIGITNAMLMSVTERVREIGTLKCLGALSSFVVRLFLIESALVGLFGALLGVVLGMVVAVGGYAYLFGFGRIFMTLDYGTTALTTLACLVVGVILAVISGIYPARAAAKMIPASALATNV